MKKRGFTLIELMVVIAIIALLITFLMPGLAAALESARQTKCGENMKATGTAVMGSSTEGILLKTGSATGYGWDDNTDSTITHMTGAGRVADPAGDSVAVPVSHNYYALIHRNEVKPDNFICPSDGDAILEERTKNDQGENYWDFAANVNLSYSYQSPFMAGGLETNPLNNPDSDVVILGDRTPFEQIDIATVGNSGQPTAVLPSSNGTWSGYQAEGSTIDSQVAMSQNHKGDAFLGLKYGGDLASSYKADCGYENDCVYTPSGEAAMTANVWSDQPYTHAIDTAFDLTNHLSKLDTLLMDTHDP